MQRCRWISVIDGDSLVGLAKIDPAALQCRSRRQTDPRAAGQLNLPPLNPDASHSFGPEAHRASLQPIC
jgi:hypothetical protein